MYVFHPLLELVHANARYRQELSIARLREKFYAGSGGKVREEKGKGKVAWE
jgi:hypothetical protein